MPLQQQYILRTHTQSQSTALLVFSPLNRHKCTTTAKILSNDNIIRHESFLPDCSTECVYTSIYMVCIAYTAVIIGFPKKSFPARASHVIIRVARGKIYGQFRIYYEHYYSTRVQLTLSRNRSRAWRIARHDIYKDCEIHRWDDCGDGGGGKRGFEATESERFVGKHILRTDCVSEKNTTVKKPK